MCGENTKPVPNEGKHITLLFIESNHINLLRGMYYQ